MFCFGMKKRLYTSFLIIVFAVIGFMEILDGYADSQEEMELRIRANFADEKRFSRVNPKARAH